MKATLKPCNEVEVEIEGTKLPGRFRVASEWEGFVKLVSDSPRQELIVHQMPPPKNPWDYIAKIFGGNRILQPEHETEIVKGDCIPKHLLPPESKET